MDDEELEQKIREAAMEVERLKADFDRFRRMGDPKTWDEQMERSADREVLDAKLSRTRSVLERLKREYIGGPPA